MSPSRRAGKRRRADRRPASPVPAPPSAPPPPPAPVTLTAAAGSEAASPTDALRTLATVSTSLWRARRACERLAADGVAVRPVTRDLETALAALADVGLEVQGHDGNPYDSGQRLTVVAFQPVADLTRETVQETLRPSIYLRGRQIQRGEVVVGVPENVPENGEPNGSENGEPNVETAQESAR